MADIYPPMNNLFNEAVKKRFWKKVHSMQASECWLWKASRDDEDYGIFYTGKETKRAHVVSYIMHYGEVPKGFIICHKCNTQRCVNPTHLYAGTYSSNAKDTYKRNPNRVPGIPATHSKEV
jgi:hypothetical protein